MLAYKPLKQIPPRGNEHLANSPGNKGVEGRRDAFSDALSGNSTPIDPDLQTVIDAWPTLPDDAKTGILAIVRRQSAG
jgi:hypothetical protein